MKLLHISPKIFHRYDDLALVDVALPQFNLILSAGKELMLSRPFPNKCLAVAGTKTKHRKSFDGFLLELPSFPSRFDLFTRWSGCGIIATHHVVCEFAEREFDFASFDELFWCKWACSEKWSDRRPNWVHGRYPVDTEPRMTITGEPKDSVRLAIPTADTVEGGFVTSREQHFVLPTSEPDRLHDERYANERIPPRETAFRVSEVLFDFAIPTKVTFPKNCRRATTPC